MILSPSVKFNNQVRVFRVRGCNENTDEVEEDGLPNPDLEIMKDIDDEYIKIILSEWAKKFRKGVLCRFARTA